MITPPSRSTGDDSTRRSLPRGVLSFGSAVAVALLVLGINGMLSGAIPRYDPTWVDVAAVALLAWFEGWLPALLAGAAAVAAYAIWLAAGPVTARSLAEPALSSLAALAITELAHRMVRRRRAAGLREEKPVLVSETAAPRDVPSIVTRPLDGGARPQGSRTPEEAIEAERAATRETARLREELSRAAADRDALQSSIQAATLRHQEESTKLKVEKARAQEEAREALAGVSSAKEALDQAQAELGAQRRAAEEAQRLADERAAAMLEGEARHGAAESRLRNGLEQESERARQDAAGMEALARDLALAVAERDRFERKAADVQQEAERRLAELSEQHAADRERLGSQLQLAGQQIDHWHQEYSRSADEFAHASASLSELSFIQSALEQLRGEHGQIARSLEAAHADNEQLRAERDDFGRRLAVALEAHADLDALRSAAGELRAENVRLLRLMEIARGEAESAASENARLMEEAASLGPLRSELERFAGMHEDAIRALEETSGDAESWRGKAESVGAELARATAELAELSTVRTEAERLHAEHATASGLLDEARADAESWRQRVEEVAAELAGATAELAKLSTIRTEAERLRAEHAATSGLLGEARADAESWRQRVEEVAAELAGATAELAKLSTIRTEAEQLRAEHANTSALLDEARADAETSWQRVEEVAAELARATAETAKLSAISAEAERLRAEHASAAQLLDAARVDAASAQDDARRAADELARTAAELPAMRSELEQLRTEKSALARAVEALTVERDTAQSRAALVAVEAAAAVEMRDALNQGRANVEQLQSENRRLAAALSTAGREAARLQADSTHYADEVIGLRSRLARATAATPEAEALRSEVTRLTGLLEEADARTEILSKEQVRAHEINRAEAARVAAEHDSERQGLRDALDGAARINAELTGHKEESERWRADAQALAARLEAAAETAAAETAAENAAAADEQHRRAQRALEVEWAARLEASEAVAASRQREIEAAARSAQERASAADEQLQSRRDLELEWTAKLEATEAAAAGLHHQIAESDSRLRAAEELRREAVAEVERLGQQFAAAQAAQAALEEELHLRDTRNAAAADSAVSSAARIGQLEEELHRVQEQLAEAGRESQEASSALDEQLRIFAEAEKGWDEKLLRIVEGMTSDHENDLGEAMIEREGAKAELRVATNQIARLESSLRAAEEARDTVAQEWKRRGEQVLASIIERETTIRAAAEREVARLRVELEARSEGYQKLEMEAAQEKQRYQEAELSWGTRLQQIVANVTDDYEADLGEAITLRETAKAELRSMANDLRKAQERLAAAEERQSALVAEAFQRDAEIERLSAAAASQAGLDSPADGEALQKKLQHAEEINSAWGNAFAERESELRREAAAQMAEVQSQLERLRKSEARMTDAFRSAAADAEALRRRLDEERNVAEAKAVERDEALRQGLLNAQQQWEDRIDSVVAEAELKLRQLRSQLAGQEEELALLRTRDLELQERREQAESEERLIARQLELSRQSDEERKARSEVLQFAEDARNLLMGDAREPASAPAERDPFPEASADPAASAESANESAASASDDFLAIVTRLSGDS